VSLGARRGPTDPGFNAGLGLGSENTHFWAAEDAPNAILANRNRRKS